MQQKHHNIATEIFESPELARQLRIFISISLSQLNNFFTLARPNDSVHHTVGRNNTEPPPELISQSKSLWVQLQKVNRCREHHTDQEMNQQSKNLCVCVLTKYEARHVCKWNQSKR